MTHVKRLLDVGEHLPLLYARIQPLLRSPKLGALLWQVPPTFRCDAGRLADPPEHPPDGYRHAFEFRHESWFREEVYTLLREHNVALVIGDRPEVKAFQAHELTADFTFVRFHHGTRGRNGNYSHRGLDEWRERLVRWSAEADVYAYFNNDWEGYAIENARYVRSRVPSLYAHA